MKGPVSLWVLCPPERGQGIIKALQRGLVKQDVMAVALPPFLPLGKRRGGDWLGCFHALGSWEIGVDVQESRGVLTLKSQLEGLLGFLEGFQSVREFLLPELTLSLVTGLDFSSLRGRRETFHKFDLVLWDLFLEWRKKNLERVELRVIQRIHKKTSSGK